MQLFFSLLMSLFMLFHSLIADADNAMLQRKEAQQFIHKMVSQYHFDKRQLIAILKDAQYQPQVIESMDKPYEKKTWDVYSELFLQPHRVEAGIAFWQANQQALEKAEREYGVPANIIVAIIGVETLYGKYNGNYRVIDALSTLAFYYPKRSPYFTKELAEYLLLCREQGVSAAHFTGSYAGAIGKPQFMPSSYRYYAVDFTGNGKRDLINDNADVVASVANYFHKHGWTMNAAVAQPAKIVGHRYKQIATNTRSPAYDLQHLMAAGVKPTMSTAGHPERAGLIELSTTQGPEYWLAYPNFYVITRYNTSPQYALVVYLFAQQLNNQWASMHAHHTVG